MTGSTADFMMNPAIAEAARTWVCTAGAEITFPSATAIDVSTGTSDFTKRAISSTHSVAVLAISVNPAAVSPAKTA